MSKRSRYSFSSLTSYTTCPAAWRQCYALDNPGIVGDNVDEGAAIHDGIARYANVCWSRPKKANYDRVEGYKIADSYPEPVRSVLRSFVEQWQWSWGDVVETGQGCPVEQELSARLPGGATFSGHIDLLRRFAGAAAERSYFGDDDTGANEDLWRITDWKRRRYKVEMVKQSQEPDAPEWPLQLLCYAWLVQQNFHDARNFELQFFTLEGFADGPWEYSGDLSWVGDLLQARFDEMDADPECEPRMGEHCTSCFYRHVCPLAGPRLEAFATGGPMKWALAAKYYEAQADFYAGMVRAGVDRTGDEVRLKGGYYGYKKPGQSWKVVSFSGLVDLLTRCADKLTNKRARLAPVARMLKVDQDVAGQFMDALLADEDANQLAASVMELTPGGSPRYGWHKYNGTGNGD